MDEKVIKEEIDYLETAIELYEDQAGEFRSLGNELDERYCRGYVNGLRVAIDSVNIVSSYPRKT